MTLLFDNTQASPQVHVLLIGVGGYPFLKNGVSAFTQVFDGASHLGQLTSPPVSVAHVYNTIMELHQQNAWITPLGSIDVLVSPAPGGSNLVSGQPVRPASMNNIRDAYFAWKNRCDTNEENIAFFFFCGHGVEKGEHYLLAEDFGSIPQNPWQQGFSFESTRRAFYKCKAKTQLFFIDACRYVTSDMLTHDIPVNPIEPPSFRSTTCKYDLVQKAAAPNEGAYGEVQSPSFYTKALIGALKGDVAERDSGEWKIGTAKLSAKMNELLGEVMPGQEYPQRCISTTSDVRDIIKLDEPPVAMLSVTCEPDEALPLAELSCKNVKTAKEETRVPQAQPWNIKVQAGVYRVKARFLAGGFTDIEEMTPVSPPLTREKLRCL
ncbi:MAG: caspase family protein [Chitinophagaceae bacterium]